ncbi:MAG: hypothetical protein ACAI35_10440, partial [Candidatus Methylacidiphilales bacterium]
ELTATPNDSNVVHLYAFGGGIYHTDSGTVTIQGVTAIENNRAVATVAMGSVTLTTNNYNTSSSANAYGGGIYSLGGTWNLTGTTSIVDNQAVATAQRAGTLQVSAADVAITATSAYPYASVSVQDNFPAEAYGGGVYADNSTWILSGTTVISGNSARATSTQSAAYTLTGGDAIASGTDAYAYAFTQFNSQADSNARGGGVYTRNGGTWTLSGTTTIIGNSALATSTNSADITLISGNATATGSDEARAYASAYANSYVSANARGGGMYISGGVWMLSGTTVINGNSALATSTNTSESSITAGNAIASAPSAIASASAEINASALTSADGGGVWTNGGSGSWTLSGTTSISQNTALATSSNSAGFNAVSGTAIAPSTSRYVSTRARAESSAMGGGFFGDRIIWTARDVEFADNSALADVQNTSQTASGGQSYSTATAEARGGGMHI